jgi:hypothetical protein
VAETQILTRIRQAFDVLRGRVQAASAGYDPTLSEADIRQGFRRISTNSTNRDLAPLTQDKMIELAWYLYDRNPLAKRLVNLTKIFVVGEGLKVKSEDARVQEWLDKFWDDPINRMDLELPEYVKELGIFGEQLYRTTENPVDGSLRLWYIDPSEIDQVVYGGAPDAEPGSDRSIAIPIEVILKQKPEEKEGPRLQVYRPDEDPNSPTFGRPIGNAFYFAINKAKRSARGRSDLFAQADWLDAYEQALFAAVDRIDLLNSFIWDVTLNDKTEDEIKAWLKENGRRPRHGSVRAHNQGVTWTTAAPELGSQDVATIMRVFKNHILGTSGFPEHWFAEGGETNLATAGEMGGPTIKTLKERQKYVKHMLEYICGVVIDRGIAHGTLPKTADRTVAINAPELETRDTSKLGAAIAQTVNAMALAVQESWLTRETAAAIFANLVSQLGHDVDVDKELKELETQLRPSEADYQNRGPGLPALNSAKQPGTEAVNPVPKAVQ